MGRSRVLWTSQSSGSVYETVAVDLLTGLGKQLEDVGQYISQESDKIDISHIRNGYDVLFLGLLF